MGTGRTFMSRISFRKFFRAGDHFRLEESRAGCRVASVTEGESSRDEEAKGQEKKICSSCGNPVIKTYQNNMCRECLVASFSKVRGMIDAHRVDHRRHAG